MKETSTPIEAFEEPHAGQSTMVKWLGPLLLLILVPILVAVAAVSKQPPSIWSTSDIVLFILTALLCTLVAVSLTLACCADWLNRIAEGIHPIGTQVLAIHDTQTRLCEAVHKSNLQFSVKTAQDEGTQRLLQDSIDRLVANLQSGTSGAAVLSETLKSQQEGTNAAIAALAAAHGRLTGDLQKLRELMQTVAGGVAEAGREQTGAHGALQESARALAATTEAIQQSQLAVQTQVETLAETTRQTLAAVNGAAAGQTAIQETTQHAADRMAGLEARQNALGAALQGHGEALSTALAALTSGQGQLTGDLQRLQELNQTTAGGVAEVAREQAAAHGAWQDSARALAAVTETMQQNQHALQTQVETVTDAARQTLAAVNDAAAGQTAIQEATRHVADQMAGLEARQNALGAALQGHGEALSTGLTALTSGQGQLTGDLRRLQELNQTVAGGVAEVAREQAAAHGVLQDRARALVAATEAIQQSQHALQTQVETVADAARKTLTAVNGAAAGQTAIQETTQHVADQMAGIEARQNALDEVLRGRHEVLNTALAALASGQGQLTGDLQKLQEWSQTTAGGVTEVAREQAAAHGVLQDRARALVAATEAIQQSQHALQTQVETVAKTACQVIAAVHGVAADQTACHATTCRVIDQMTTSQGQLTGEVQELQALTQTIAGSVSDATYAQAAALEAIHQGHATLRRQVQEMMETGKQTTATVTAVAAEQTSMHEAARRIMNEMTGVGTRQAALGEKLQARQEALDTALVNLAARQGQLTDDLRQLHELTRTVAGNVTNVACEQATARNTLQDNVRLLSAFYETMQRSQQSLQTEVEKVADTARRAVAAVRTLAEEQTSGRETTRHMIGEVAGAAIAALAGGYGRLTGDIQQLQSLAQTVADSCPREIPSPAAFEPAAPCSRLSAAQAIVHGEQIRYEAGPGRDNLGYWNEASDWVQWELDVARPGRFKVLAEIAALSPSRFRVVLGAQSLVARAPVTGDYGRFQEVELGVVELTTAGRMELTVRPIPEDWQPINLRSVELVPLA